ncbi:hypothetical protein REPUB_Repub01dG0093700 [Reevesia pubescens]
MVSQGIKETAPTFSSVITACGNGGFYREGIQVHCRVISLEFGLNLFIGSSLVNFYLHMGLDEVALKLFDQLPERNLAVWNLILNGFFELGKQLHCPVIKAGWVECNIFVANALVDFYSACGNFIDARKSFSLIPVEDVISWNSIISVHAENALLCDALELFSMMHYWGKKPSIRSFLWFLNLSSRKGDIYVEALSVYESASKRTLECCNSLITSLLHCGITEDVFEMFGLMVDEGVGIDEIPLSTTLKALSASTWAGFDCCRLLHCCAVFETLPSPNVFCFASIINGYARNGMGREGVSLLEAMIQDGLIPDKVAFLCVLSGCNHAGLVERNVGA